MNQLISAINHCQEIIDSKLDCDPCRQEHIQLKEWLTELFYRKYWDTIHYVNFDLEKVKSIYHNKNTDE